MMVANARTQGGHFHPSGTAGHRGSGAVRPEERATRNPALPAIGLGGITFSIPHSYMVMAEIFQ